MQPVFNARSASLRAQILEHLSAGRCHCPENQGAEATQTLETTARTDRRSCVSTLGRKKDICREMWIPTMRAGRSSFGCWRDL